MPFPRPTLSALFSQALGFLVARLAGADSRLRRSTLSVIARLAAGNTNLEFGYLDWLIRQLFVTTSDPPYLYIQGAEYGMAPEGATVAAGNIIFTGAINGTVIDLATALQVNGVFYETQQEVTLAAGTATAPVEAVAGGSAGNQPPGTTLSIVTAIAGINGTATVDENGLTGGTDTESPDAFRARVLERKAAPPQGGDPADYVAWAKSIPGVTRAWVYPLNRGAGTVDVSFVMDGRTDIIPLSADVAAVQAYLGTLGGAVGVKPVTADALVFAPAAYPVNLTIHGLVPNNAATQAAIAAAIADLLVRVGSPGTSSGTGCTIAYADLDDAIEGAAGVTYHFLASPGADITVPFGQMPVPGTITYT